MKTKNKEMRRTNVKKTLVWIIILGLFLANFVAIAGASPDLTEAGKRYIAEKIGIGDCWVYSGLSWVAESVLGDRVDRTGGTGKAVKDIVDPVTDHIEIGGLNISKTTLRNNNDGNDVTITDVTGEILLNDGYPEGENQYCIGGTPTPTPTPLVMARKWTDNQIAEHAGKPNKCITKFTATVKERVLTYWDRDGIKYTDGITTDVLAALMTGGKNSAGKTVTDLGLPSPTLDDIIWAADEQEKATPYCYSVVPTPTPTPTPIPSIPSPTSTLTPSPTPTQTPSPPPVYTPAPMHTPTLSPISSPSPTPTLVDSDGDGVLDRYDYAPYDPNVQTKGDIKPETTPTPQPLGFEVLFVIVGLLLVAYLIKRRVVK